ncbi:hypothetical protein [Kitasatospora indigofera]|uniref:hypothetical protein n=1 Tax=Kitasatospora indigofera TaxID=67307 RepID=UPI0036A5BC8D
MTIQQKAVRRLSAGSAEVARRLGRRAATANIWAKIGGGLVLWKGGPGLLESAHQQPLLPAAAAGAWCWAAWRAGRPPESAEETEPDTAEELASGGDETAQFLALLHRLMPAPGDRIHLAQIAAEMTGDRTATGPVRELCATAGIPISDVRVRGRGSSTGIYRRDVPPLPDPSRQPLPGVVGAGQGQQQQHQQQSDTALREGFLIKDDPDNPARSQVHWIKEPAS